MKFTKLFVALSVLQQCDAQTELITGKTVTDAAGAAGAAGKAMNIALTINPVAAGCLSTAAVVTGIGYKILG